MKKRLLAGLLTVVMLFSMLPVSALAADMVAQIDSTTYSSWSGLAQAWSASYDETSNTIKLASDVELSKILYIYGTVTIDLNGYTLSRDYTKTGGGNTAIIVSGGSLTVEDSSGDNSGKISAATYAINAQNSGTITINGGTITTTDEQGANVQAQTVCANAGSTITINGGAISGEYAVVVFGTTEKNGAETKLTVNGGTITGTGAFAICTNGTTYKNTIEITGGTITSTSAQAIYLPGMDSTTTVSGGTITGTSGIEIRAGSLYVSGGTITGTGNLGTESNGSGSTTSGVGIAISQHSTNDEVTVIITGGTISGYYGVYEINTYASKNSSAVKITISGDKTEVTTTSASSGGKAVYSESDTTGGSTTNADAYTTVTVSSGTYNTDVSDYLDNSVEAVLEYTESGTTYYSYYSSYTDALAAAETANYTGVTIALVDVDESNLISVTLDPNGGTVSVTTMKGKAGSTVTLPTPTRSSYTFKGWLDDTGTIYISSYTIPQDDVTLTAQWSRNGSSYYYEDISYRITVEDSKNGEVEVSETRAYEGDKITITVAPDDGYELDELIVTNVATGKTIKLTEKSEGTYTFTMPDSRVIIEAIFVKVEEEEVLGTLIKVVPSTPFTDISNSRYKDAIAYVYDAGLMNGITATTFEPGSTLTRGMIVTVLYRLAGEPEVSGSSIFADVADGQWYTNAIIWATENGIVNGYGNGSFGPNDEVTREQMMAIFYRYASQNGYYMGNTFALDGFTDNADVSAYAVTALEWGFANSMIQSRTTAMINPKDAATRAEVAQALYILIK